MREIKISCENTRNKENREIIESVRFENGSSVAPLKLFMRQFVLILVTGLQE